MLRFAICDDEAVFAQELKNEIISCCNKINVDIDVQIYSDGNVLLEGYGADSIDVIFLDIDMPKLSGMEVARCLFEKNRYQLVVFVTSHEELVFQALNLQPLNFIRKNTYKFDLMAVMQSIVDKVNRSVRSHMFHFNGSTIKLKLDDIMVISSVRHTITVTCLNGNVFNVTDTMRNLENMLSPYDFVRASSGCIVNLKYITVIEKTDAVLDDGTRILVSRYQMANLKERFKLFLR